MKSEQNLEGLLKQLKLSALATEFSRDEMVTIMKNLLAWLNQPENDTDNNCKRIDHFISLEIISENKFESLPKDIQDILFDMGATLHDTHTEPALAKNFQSTPSQLLIRIQNL